MPQPLRFAPGLRIEARDAEWSIRKVDLCRDGGYLLTCEGHSELVRGVETIFWTVLDPDIRILNPEDTELVADTSSGFGASLLYLDTALRKSPPTHERIAVAHRAAMDVLPFQLDPALQALSKPRQRILIADSVGLGKTLEAGILISELIARGRGRRILVLAVKSMLAQFQRELWSRFTIPLVRLDSAGLQRVRSRIPSNHNPFQVFDKAIISIDTLKQDLEYRHYLDDAYWDIIVIDEAHNVADRSSGSLRSRLARRLATRSDTLILLSATPHDGKPESFASLVNMLDPTAIADPKNYVQEDFRDRGLVVRRFKSDVRAQLTQNFPERVVHDIRVPASAPEEAALSRLHTAVFRSIDGKTPAAGQLFRTTLTKALLSSPAACLSTIEHRLKRLQAQPQREDVALDIEQLEDLRHLVARVGPAHFSKYQRLLGLLGRTGKDSIGWNPKADDDRLVVFTESLKTLAFLREHLPADLGIAEKSVGVLSGEMRDVDLMEMVEAFSTPKSPVRLLLCSDVASEGLNLHHLSHRLIHFDIPWSLMVFQQRNGRIDRYGQHRRPELRYLVTSSADPAVAADLRVLDVLLEKDEQAGVNLGDPSEFMRVFSETDEEALTAAAFEAPKAADDDISALFESLLEDVASAASPLDAFVPDTPSTTRLEDALALSPRLFQSDFDYAVAAIRFLRESRVEVDAEFTGDRMALTPPPDLEIRLRALPREARADGARLVLTANRARIGEDLKRRQDEESLWPALHYLWPLHPVMEWLGDRALHAFGRHKAPVVATPSLPPGHSLVLLQGGFPNRRGHILVHDWIGVRFDGSRLSATLDLDATLTLLALRPGELANRGIPIDTESLQGLLPTAVAVARERLSRRRGEREQQLTHRLDRETAALQALKSRHLHAVQLQFAVLHGPESVQNRRRSEREAQIEEVFGAHLEWLFETQSLEEEPYLQVAAAFVPSEVTSR